MMTEELVSDWDIQAYIDNELPPDKEREILACLTRDADLRERYKALERQKALLRLWWREH